MRAYCDATPTWARGRELRGAAARAAAAAPWSLAMGACRLEPAVGGKAVPHTEALGGKLVGVYVTASWCGPCRRFSPKLVELHARARVNPEGFNPLSRVNPCGAHGIRTDSLPAHSRDAATSNTDPKGGAFWSLLRQAACLPFEVMMVPWDESEDELRKYARSCNVTP